MNKNNNIKIYVTIAILASLASIFSVLDKIIIASLFPYIPGIKIGLANIITLFSIYNTKFKYAFIEVIIKIVLTSFILGSLTTFIIGGISSLISFFAMYISFRYLKTKTSIITISVIGGFIHINCQLIITKFIYKLGDDIYMYGAVLIIISLVMSIIVGIITNKLNKANFISKMH